MFQFHNGIIKSSRSSASNAGEKMFQFHNGIIKSRLHRDYPSEIEVSIPQWYY